MNELFSLENFFHKELFENTTYPWEALLRLRSYLEKKGRGKIEIEVSSSVYLINKESIHIGKGTQIEPGAYIEGPCVIGENCIIRHGAYIRGLVLMGNQCVIGHASEVKRSILLNKATASHFNYVGDSILGNGVNLGAGAVCANMRLDRKEIAVLHRGEKIPTSLKKLGALIGDGAQIACNCVLNPGVVIEKNALVKLKNGAADVHANL